MIIDARVRDQELCSTALCVHVANNFVGKISIKPRINKFNRIKKRSDTSFLKKIIKYYTTKHNHFKLISIKICRSRKK